MAIRFKPSADRVVVEPAPAAEKTASGLYIPDTAKEKPQKGTIVAIGAGRYADLTGNLIPMSHQIGDQVYYGKHVGIEVTLEGKEFLILRESDILGVL